MPDRPQPSLDEGATINVRGQRPPWSRRAEESAPAYRAFKFYLDLGEARTILSAYNAYRLARGDQEAKKLFGFSK